MPPASRRLSESPLWSAQRRFYQTAGIDAWRSGTVPHHVTNSVALVEAYMRIVCAFALAPRSREPVHVVELGAGPGRFAFLFLRALEQLGRAAPPIRYVMTDVPPATIEFWTRHPALVPFIRAGRLDVAHFDAARDTTITLLLERREIAPATPVERLVVVASYVFSSLPQDAFVARGGRLHEWLVHTGSPRRRPDAMTLQGRPGRRAAAPYPDDALNRVLADASPARGVRLFPLGALRCLERMTALVRGDALVLVADRPDPGAGVDAATLGMGRHGAVSFPLDLMSLHAWARHRGGVPLSSSRRARHLATLGLLLGAAPKTVSATRTAWRRVMARGGPDALYHRRRALSVTSRPPLRSLLALLRASGSDPRVVAECLRLLWPHLPRLSAALRLELRDIAMAAWQNDYHLGESHDVAFDLGLLLYAVHAWPEARELFEASRRRYGEDAATHWNLALCHLALGDGDSARTALAEARTLAPGLNAAGPVTVKLGAS